MRMMMPVMAVEIGNWRSDTSRMVPPGVPSARCDSSR
jgi:hypothetical protein